jgi:hypothetical protein
MHDNLFKQLLLEAFKMGTVVRKKEHQQLWRSATVAIKKSQIIFNLPKLCNRVLDWDSGLINLPGLVE